MKVFEDATGIRGQVNYTVRDSDGSVVLEFERRNLVTNVGKALVAGLLIGTGSAASNVAIGTGTTDFAATSTQLNNEYARGTATTSTTQTTVANDTAALIMAFSFTETKAIVESGVLNAAVAGSLVCAQTFSAINVVSGDSCTLTWKISFS
jgi:hypothetical protein